MERVDPKATLNGVLADDDSADKNGQNSDSAQAKDPNAPEETKRGPKIGDDV